MAYIGKVPTAVPLGTSDLADSIVTSAKITDGTIVLADLSATGTKDATTFLRGDNTFAEAGGGVNTPAFLAYISADQTIGNATFTKAQFNTEVFDVGGCYDNVTNYRFTPNVAGKYMIFSNLQMELSDYGIYQVQTLIKKNGLDYANIKAVTYLNVLFGIHAPIQHIIEFNGTTDYVEIFGYMERHSSSGNKFENGTKASFFGAYKIIE